MSSNVVSKLSQVSTHISHSLLLSLLIPFSILVFILSSIHREYGWFPDDREIEFASKLRPISGNEDKIRIVLNKSDMVDHQQLMRVYGALMWSLGKVEFFSNVFGKILPFRVF